jgi:hypothetical protein
MERVIAAKCDTLCTETTGQKNIQFTLMKGIHTPYISDIQDSKKVKVKVKGRLLGLSSALQPVGG